MENIVKANLLDSQRLFYLSQSWVPAPLPDIQSQRTSIYIQNNYRQASSPSQDRSPTKDSASLSSFLHRKEVETSELSLEILGNKALAPRTRTMDIEWHAPWKLMRVITGHEGWVRCVSVDPTNHWFASGSVDNNIKIWDLASGRLKVTLEGHTSPVRAVEVSDRHAYLFSCAEDKGVFCWDLEHNKVIRSFHGHLSGVYTLALHPSLDIITTGGRDCVCRVWDIRTKAQVRILEGHRHTISTLASQSAEPQLISGSADCTLKLWDIGSGNAINTLTRHKKGIRAVTIHNSEYSFLSAAADALRIWKCPDGQFLRHFDNQQGIVNALAINENNVMVSAGDDGSLFFWDYPTGFSFCQLYSRPQPGSLDCESGVFDCAFDKSGLRLITAECDKTIKIWKEDEEATPISHPIPSDARVFVRS